MTPEFEPRVIQGSFKIPVIPARFRVIVSGEVSFTDGRVYPTFPYEYQCCDCPYSTNDADEALMHYEHRSFGHRILGIL